jgi:hypothetical protein
MKKLWAVMFLVLFVSVGSVFAQESNRGGVIAVVRDERQYSVYIRNTTNTPKTIELEGIFISTSSGGSGSSRMGGGSNRPVVRAERRMAQPTIRLAAGEARTITLQSPGGMNVKLDRINLIDVY